MNEIATEAEFEAWKSLTDKLLWPLRRAVEKANAKAIAEDIETAEALETYEAGPKQTWSWKGWDSFRFREITSVNPFTASDSAYTRVTAVGLTEQALSTFEREAASVNQRNRERYARNVGRAKRLAAALISLGFQYSVPTGKRKPFRSDTPSTTLADRLVSYVPYPPAVSTDCVYHAKRWMEAERQREFAEAAETRRNEAAERLIKRGYKLGTDFTIQNAETFEERHPAEGAITEDDEDGGAA